MVVRLKKIPAIQSETIRTNNAMRNREKDDGQDLIRNMGGSVSSGTLYTFFKLICFFIVSLKTSQSKVLSFL